MLNTTTRSNIFLLLCLIANVTTFPTLVAMANPAEKTVPRVENDEQEFTFVGKCPNGNSYRIFSYQMTVDGLTKSFYDYEGPAGKGTVQTEAQPRKMAVRICHELADIRDGSKYD